MNDFLDAPAHEPSVASLFAWLILFLFYLLASGGLVPFVAREKGRSGLSWMLLALLSTPLLALIALAAVPVKEEEEEEESSLDVDEIPEYKWRKG